MNTKIYLEKEFSNLRERINKEILRRSTYSWWNPLAAPTVGQDQTPPLAIHNDGNAINVTDRTYTINNPSTGSIEPTRNISYPAYGDNPGGDPNIINTSASKFDLDEIKNFLVGLANIKDINLFYGRDEIDRLGFRDPNSIEEVLVETENNKLNELVDYRHQKKLDPNNGKTDDIDDVYPTFINAEYSYENNLYQMKSGESDGEESPPDGLSENYFFDDYGAKPGDSNFHTYATNSTALVNRDWNNQDNNRNIIHKIKYEGGINRSKYGLTPRNPDPGEPYRSRPAYQGGSSSCETCCTGLCSITCDNECSESCLSTCFNRCGEACTSSCGNVCTGCAVHCYSSCKTKCENNVGYSCVNNGAQTFKVTKLGGQHGIPAENKVETKYYSCSGCSYSCQFYPNKKTECWDSACMGRCFTSCNISCSSSCFGGCIDNAQENEKDYKVGRGRGCSAGCTINCVGDCTSSCEGYCVTECWMACKQQCSDDCSWSCDSNCGNGCANNCHTAAHTRAVSCGETCSAKCSNACDNNCIGFGCKSICGIESHGACSANCRINCMSTSCTAKCSDACSGQCSNCINTCNLGCGMCTSQCSTGCSAECNITCISQCESDCSFNCSQSCTDACSGCFEGHTLVETIDGPVYIKDLKINDLVLTHDGTYQKVISISKRMADENETIMIHPVGALPTYTTKEHPFFTRRYKDYYKVPCDNIGYQRYNDPLWVDAGDLNNKDKISLLTPEIGNVRVNNGIAYFVGRWLGDGWIRDAISNINNKSYRTFYICCGYHEEDDFDMKLKQAGIIYKKYYKATSINYTIPSKKNRELCDILKKCGKYAIKKHLSEDIFKWDEEALSYLIMGYIDADGHIYEDFKQFSISSINKVLIYQISIILRMLELNPGICEYKANNTTSIIEGRVVNNSLYRYSLQGRFYRNSNRCYTRYDLDNMVWSSVRRIHDNVGLYEVYNLTVDVNHTFYANGILVHNCSNLCYSCVGKCIGVCSVKCTDGCTNCANLCTFWCDSRCNNLCHINCSSYCINTCEGSCIGYLASNTKSRLKGPERKPTNRYYKYPYPKNREEERDSFIILDYIDPPNKKRVTVYDEYKVIIVYNKNGFEFISDLDIDYEIRWSTIHSGVFSIDSTTGEYTVNKNMLPGIINSAELNFDNEEAVAVIIIRSDDKLDANDIYIDTPFGFTWNTANGDDCIYAIIRLDPFFLDSKRWISND